jgi:hypothetical protein
MSRARNWLLGACAAILVSPVAVRAQEEISLAPKFAQGDEKKYVASVQFTRTDEFVGADIPEAQKRAMQESTLELGVTRRIAHVSENEAAVELEFTRIKLVSRDPMKVLEFDSDQPVEQDSSSPLAAALRPMVGSIVTLQVANDGIIKSIQRPVGLEGTQASGSMVAQIMGDEPIRELFGPLFAPKPPPPTAVSGSTWTKVDFVPIGPNRKSGINVRRTDTLSSAAQGQAVIDIKGVLSMKTDPEATEKLPELKESNLEGTIVWDLEAGMLRAYDISQMIRIEGVRENVTISTKNQSQTSVRLVD